MKYELHLYKIDKKFIRDLHNVDNNVMSVSPQIGKETRPFIGVVVLFNKRQYCIPLTSPNKDKFKGKSQMDFVKIFDNSVKDEKGVSKIIGILNINNMIPVDKSVIKKIDLSLNDTDSKDIICRKRLMIDQLKWCRDNYSTIERKANKVYKVVTETPNKNRNLTRRCCDFQKLEKVLDKYLGKKTHDIEIKGKTISEQSCEKPKQVSQTGSIFGPEQITKNAAKISEKHDRSRSADKSKGRNKPEL